MGLLEAFALSVPDKYTKTGSEEVYSPKEDKNVKMDVITTTLDAKAVNEIAKNFADKLDDNKELNRNVQQILYDFTDFAKVDEIDLGKLLNDMQDSAKSEEIESIEASWSVYSREGSYVGMKFELTNKDIDFSYTMMSEVTEYESFNSVKSDTNGAVSESMTHVIWKDNRAEMSGDTSTILSPGMSSAEYQIGGTMEFVKVGSNEYSVVGNFTIEGDVVLVDNSSSSMSYDFGIDAGINVGGGLGTLRENRDWDGIYDKEWGSIEDIFGGLFPEGFMEYDTGSNL
jgi:hypothetical protein